MRFGDIRRLLVPQHVASRRQSHSDMSSVIEEIQAGGKMAADAENAVAEIDADPRHSPAGRAAAKAEFANRALADLEKREASWMRKAAEHRSALEAEMASAVAEPKAQDLAARIEGVLLRGEIRRAAASLDQAGVEQLYRLCPAARPALEELPKIEVTKFGPRVTRFVSEELRRTVMLEAGKEKLPANAQMLESLDAAGGAIKAVYGALRHELEGLAREARSAYAAATGTPHVPAAESFRDPTTGAEIKRPVPRA